MQLVKVGYRNLLGGDVMNRRSVIAGAGALSALMLGAGRSSSQEIYGHFDGRLVLDAGSEGRLMKLIEPYSYIDRSGERWEVPSGVTVDGASIPQPFWSIIGGPFEGAYRNASVIHDYFCDIRVRPWQDVHRMFYEAMLSNKVDKIKAKIMYLAVYYGGPRWSEVVIRNMRILQVQGANSKGGAEGIEKMGDLQRIPTGLGVDIAVPKELRGKQDHGAADYTIIALEKPIVDVYVFEKMMQETTIKDLNIEQIEELVESKRLGL